MDADHATGAMPAPRTAVAAILAPLLAVVTLVVAIGVVGNHPISRLAPW